MKTIGVIWLTFHSMNQIALETRDVGPISLYFMDNVKDRSKTRKYSRCFVKKYWFQGIK